MRYVLLVYGLMGGIWYIVLLGVWIRVFIIFWLVIGFWEKIVRLLLVNGMQIVFGGGGGGGGNLLLQL